MAQNINSEKYFKFEESYRKSREEKLQKEKEIKTCPICNTEFHGKSNQIYCCKKCAEIASKIRSKIYRESPEIKKRIKKSRENSESVKKAYKKYSKSEKGKACKKKYNQSEKGKIALKKAYEKYKANGYKTQKQLKAEEEEKYRINHEFIG